MLASHCESLSGYPFPSAEFTDEPDDTETIACIPPLRQADELGRHRMQPGDIVFGRRDEIGRRAAIGSRQVGYCCGTGCLRLRPDPARIHPRFLFEMLGAPTVAGEIANRAKGLDPGQPERGRLADRPPARAAARPARPFRQLRRRRQRADRHARRTIAQTPNGPRVAVALPDERPAHRLNTGAPYAHPAHAARNPSQSTAACSCTAQQAGIADDAQCTATALNQQVVGQATDCERL